MDDHQTGGPRHRSRRKEDAVIRQTIFAGVTSRSMPRECGVGAPRPKGISQ